MLGEKLRNYGFWTLDFLKGSKILKHYRDIEKMLIDEKYYEEHSCKYQKLLMDKASSETEFYRDYEGIYDLNKFPVINKIIIKEHLNEFMSNKYDRNKLHVMYTSGSTGIPFKAFQNKEKRQRVLAELIYYGNKIGYKVGKKLVYSRFLDVHAKKSKVKLFLQNEEIYNANDISDENIKNICEKILKFDKKVFVMSYPSTLALIINRFEDMGITKIENVSGIITVAEVLSKVNRQKIKDMFSCSIVARYSNQENGLLAQDCDRFNEYHVNRADYIVEILKLDSDEKAEEGEIGRVVITDLFNYAMPMIRYDTGDIASLVNKSLCIENSPVLANLEGRRLDMLFDTSGKRLSFFSIDEIFYEIPYIRQHQLIQKSVRDFVLKLVCKENSNVENEKIINRLKEIVGEDANIELICSEGIPVMNSGKFKYIVNLMNK